MGATDRNVERPHAANDRKAVLFLLNSLVVGGSERKTVRLANTLVGSGWDVVLAYLNTPETLLADVDPRVRVVHLRRRGPFSLAALYRLTRTVRSYNVGTIVAVNLYPTLYARFVRPRSGERPLHLVAWINTTEFITRKEAAQMTLYRHVLRHMSKIIFGAYAQQELWRMRYGVGLRPGSSVVLYNGVDIEVFRRERVSPTRPSNWPQARFIVGTVGKLRLEKAHDHLLRAVAQMRERGLDVGAVIVGDGPQRPLLEATAIQLGLNPYVLFAGETRDVRPYLAAFDVFVLTSVAVETFSNAALEAMAMSCPTISSEVGGMRELLRHGGGVSYPAGDIAALRDVLCALLGDDARRKETGCASASRRRSTFRLEPDGW